MWERGHDLVVGVDEVGRGAWAGPLMVGAAVLPRDTRVNGVRDSKLLTEREREALFARIANWCVSWSVGAASQQECDSSACPRPRSSPRAGRSRGSTSFPTWPSDGTWDFVSPSVAHVELAVKADLRCLSVAAASILAKVTRDREMRQHAVDYPNWSFDTNKGYPCPVHKAALIGYGPSSIHRRTWVFMDHYVPWSAIKRTPPAGQTAVLIAGQVGAQCAPGR